MSQCANFLDMLNRDEVKDGDIIFLQDYWHPGIESILYAIDLYGIDLKIYSMLHAQSVDEYDFTYPMKNWMRGFELGLDKRMTGIFVGSTIHKEQLRQAGFEAPIHVVSLPLHCEMALNKYPKYDPLKKRENKVVYSSRLDKEKNPFFMLEVAEHFLDDHPGWVWHVTTSGKEFKSSLPDVLDRMRELEKRQPRFVCLQNLTKEEYYQELATAHIQFNSALQDYVSWTVLEATLFGCDVVYPNFRSFPEFIPQSKLYQPFDVNDCLNVFKNVIESRNNFETIRFPIVSDLGRRMEAYIIANDHSQEINVWHEEAYCNNLLEKEKHG
jgi:glycosyltransferase involved in cell wall biosynthesis